MRLLSAHTAKSASRCHLDRARKPRSQAAISNAHKTEQPQVFDRAFTTNAKTILKISQTEQNERARLGTGAKHPFFAEFREPVYELSRTAD